MARIKVTAPLINSRAAAEELLGEISLLTIELNEQKLSLDRKLAAAREEFETPIAALQKGIKEKASLMESWASNNPDEFPKGIKSIKMMHGVIGFRTGTHKLKTLLKKKWDTVLEKIQAMRMPELIRTTEEVNKEQIISDYLGGKLTYSTMREIGVEVVQDESFFIEPKLEAAEGRIVQ